jgi:HSP20 family molecular chaperone IbpA
MKRSVKSAAKLTTLESAEQINAELARVQDRIRQRAYEISMSRGHGAREVDDWLSAESEIISIPPTEIIELDDAYMIRVAIAGVESKDVEVLSAGNEILIRAEFQHDHREHQATIHLCDFKSAVVFRKIDLPGRIDLSTMEMEFRDGILRIAVNKEGASSRRKAQKAENDKPAARSATSPRSKSKAKD